MKREKNTATEIYEYIKRCIDNGMPPSVREICQELEIKSTSTAHKYLKILEEDGLIVREEGLNRNIKLPQRKSRQVPILGTVRAGAPILAAEHIEGYVGISAEHDTGGELFALKVVGDSMIGAGIFEGDILIVRKTPTVENGEIVVALIDDEATVKTFYRENGMIRLQPENDALEPIIVKEALILGKVISLTRYY